MIPISKTLVRAIAFLMLSLSACFVLSAQEAPKTTPTGVDMTLASGSSPNTCFLSPGCPQPFATTR